MPQLNPSPWLTTFLIAWSVFLLLFLNKTTKFTHQNTPPLKKMKDTLMYTWNWPWY